MRDFSVPKQRDKQDWNINIIPDESLSPSYDPRTGQIVDYSKIKIGTKILQDATITSPLTRLNSNLANRDTILRALDSCDRVQLCNISNFFFNVSGIYKRLCEYLANLYMYDWYVTPFIQGGDTYPADMKDVLEDISAKGVNKILDNFFNVLNYLDNFNAKSFFMNVAERVVVDGCYYGYIIHSPKGPSVQELSPQYCRSRLKIQGRPAVEFNFKYFDDLYRDKKYRDKIVKLFPDDFQKGYRLYVNKKLPPLYPGDAEGWYLLDPEYAIKFSLNQTDTPIMAAVIPAIIDLDEAQELDKKRMAQKLFKLIIQQMPLDKNGDPIFDNDEIQIFHNNAVKMLSRATGIDVLTTMADVEVADMADHNTTTTVDDLSKVERTVYNEAGVSQMQFNTSTNLALEKSIGNDAALMKKLVLQFEQLLNMLIEQYNKNPKKVFYRAQILLTTIYDYKDMAKIYKEQAQMGYSKMLPQICLGQSQSTVLATAFFENDLLNLVTVFVPPLTSNTMNADALSQQQTGRRRTGVDTSPGSGEVGRPEKSDDEKSTKTIQNLESQS